MCISIGKSLKLNRIDVTDEYANNAKPNVGKITMDDDLIVKDHQSEIEVAEWLLKTYGGNIHIMQEHSGPKFPDYEWNGKLWDLKDVTTAQAAKGAIARGRAQIHTNAGGIILDYKNNDISLKDVIDVIDKKAKHYENGIGDIIIRSKGKTVKIFRY